MSVTLVASKTFLRAKDRLSVVVREKVAKCMEKFRQNPDSNGLNLEPLSGPDESRLYSVRVDKSYRMIVSKQGPTVYVFVYVANHDDAYKWAENRRVEYNSYTGAVQDFVVFEPETSTDTGSLFERYTDDELLSLGVPELQMRCIRSLKNESDLVAARPYISEDVFEYLVRVAQGEPIGIMYGEISRGKTRAADISQLGDNPVTGTPKGEGGVVIIKPNLDLFPLIREPLEEWRIFLDSSQREIVSETFSGPARVLGGPGTGKTVVAMHRAKYLASLCGEDEKVLYITYNTNLPTDIWENLKKLCSEEELKKIEVNNIADWTEQFLKGRGVKAEIVYKDEILDPMWTAAITSASVTDVPIDLRFYKSEWSEVVTVLDEINEENYLASSRLGRETSLSESQSRAVWKVIEEYMKLLKKKNVLDGDAAMYKAKQLLKNVPEGLYKHVIVDEGQDLGNTAYILIRALAGKEHENDLFIVGDSRQKIYDKNPSLSACGINIEGRSSILRRNYRTTEEIARYASALVEGISFDDMDDGESYMDVKSVSLLHGEPPTIVNLLTQDEEVKFVANEINKLTRSGVKAKDICIASRIGNKAIERYRELLEAEGIQTYELRNKPEERSHDDVVRIATMHRVKGLEFKYMFIVSVNDGIVPNNSALRNKEHREEQIEKERCVLYVAMTRAKLGVYITSYGIPSQFIQKTLF